MKTNESKVSGASFLRGVTAVRASALGAALSITLAGTLTHATPPPGSVLALQDNFESDTAGLRPSGWNITADPTNADLLVANDIAGEGAQSLHVFDYSTNLGPSAYHYFTQTATPDMTLSLTFDWSFKSTDPAANYLVILNGGAYVNVITVLTPNAVYDWSWAGNGAFPQVASVTSDTWYQANLTVHPAMHQTVGAFDMVITRLSDNAQVASVTNLPYLPATTSWNMLLLQENSVPSYTGTDLHLDNFVVSFIPEPSTALSCLIGGFALLALRKGHAAG